MAIAVTGVQLALLAAEPASAPDLPPVRWQPRPFGLPKPYRRLDREDRPAACIARAECGKRAPAWSQTEGPTLTVCSDVRCWERLQRMEVQP